MYLKCKFAIAFPQFNSTSLSSIIILTVEGYSYMDEDTLMWAKKYHASEILGFWRVKYKIIKDETGNYFNYFAYRGLIYN